MKYSGISVEILEGGTTRITVTVDFARSEQIEPGDIPALEQKLREWAGEEAPAPEEKPKETRGRPKQKVEEPEVEEVETKEEPKPARRRGRPGTKAEETEEAAPRKRAPRKQKKDDDGISDRDLVKACASAKEEIDEVYEEGTGRDTVNGVMDEFGATSVGDIDQEQRQEFLDKLKAKVEELLEDED